MDVVVDGAKGSDILLEAVLESEVANNAKDFFSQPENQIKREWKGRSLYLLSISASILHDSAYL